MQPRFERRAGASPYSLIEQPRYRAAYDFLRLRADCGEVEVELADWWEDFALGTPEEREALVASVREAQRGQPRRVPRPEGVAPIEPAPAPEEGTAPARKRRRRRRKPGGGTAGPAPETAA
jgi:poly(A) polymerase